MRNRWKSIVTVLDKQIKQCNSLQNHPESSIPLIPPLINQCSGVTLAKLKDARTSMASPYDCVGLEVTGN